MHHPLSPSFLRQRKMALFLPLLFVPFLSILFFLSGGGKGLVAADHSLQLSSGLNANVPTAAEDSRVSQIYSSKLKAYENVSEDSLTRKKRNIFSFLQSDKISDLLEDKSENMGFNYDIHRTHEQQLHAPEQAAYKEARKEIEKVNTIASANVLSSAGSRQSYRRSYSSKASAISSEEYLQQKMVDDYEKAQKQQQELYEIMKDYYKNGNMGAGHNPFAANQVTAHSPEVTQTNTAQKSTETVKRKALKVKIEDPIQPVVSSLQQKDTHTEISETNNSLSINPANTSEFFTAGKTSKAVNEANVIMAAIHEEQSILSGSTVKMRLLNSIMIGDIVIPKNHFIYGVCAISDERLQINITSLKYMEMVFTIQLTVYDADGLEGIYMPGSISRTAIKQGVGQGVGNVNLLGFSPTIGAQLTQTAIDAGKSILAKKAALIRVTLKANYQVFLKPSQSE